MKLYAWIYEIWLKKFYDDLNQKNVLNCYIIFSLILEA